MVDNSTKVLAVTSTTSTTITSTNTMVGYYSQLAGTDLTYISDATTNNIYNVYLYVQNLSLGSTYLNNNSVFRSLAYYTVGTTKYYLDTSGFYFLCNRYASSISGLLPFAGEYSTFYEELMVEFVTRYDVPAIQFDDHMSLKNTFGYDDFTLDLYKKETGRAGKPQPEASDWLSWRAGKLTQFIARISRAIKTARPGIKFSVSPNPYPWSYQNYVQDWPQWVESGLVDEVVVQVYRDNMGRFQGELSSPVLEKAKGKANVIIGVLSGLKPEPMPIEMVRAQTNMVRDFGFQGVVYFFQESLLQFTASGETVENRLNVIKQLFPSPARTP